MAHARVLGGDVLTDSEVDRRFAMLVAGLNSVVQTVDWRRVSEPADQHAGDDAHAGGHADAGIVAVRLLAVVVASVMVVAGIVLARTVGGGILAIIVWFALVVPGATLGALMLFDRIRREP